MYFQFQFFLYTATKYRLRNHLKHTGIIEWIKQVKEAKKSN